MEQIIIFLAPHLRKWIFGACLTWITLILTWAETNNVPITQLDVEKFIEIGVAIAIMLSVSFYSYLKARLGGKTIVAVPAQALPEVKFVIKATTPEK